MYRHNKNLHREARIDRRVRYFFVSLVMIVGVGAITGYLYIRQDNTTGQTLGSQGSARVEQGQKTVRFSTPLYSFDAPDTWAEIDAADAVYTFRSFASTTPGEDARRLDIYENRIPPPVSATRVVTVTTTDTSITPLDRSPQCITLQEEDVSDIDRFIEWNEVFFNCNPDRNRHILIAASEEDGMGLLFGDDVEEGVPGNALYFVYTDHTSRQDYEIFDDILSSVIVKEQ